MPSPQDTIRVLFPAAFDSFGVSWFPKNLSFESLSAYRAFIGQRLKQQHHECVEAAQAIDAIAPGVRNWEDLPEVSSNEMSNLVVAFHAARVRYGDTRNAWLLVRQLPEAWAGRQSYDALHATVEEVFATSARGSQVKALREILMTDEQRAERIQLAAFLSEVFSRPVADRLSDVFGSRSAMEIFVRRVYPEAEGDLKVFLRGPEIPQLPIASVLAWATGASDRLDDPKMAEWARFASECVLVGDQWHARFDLHETFDLLRADVPLDYAKAFVDESSPDYPLEAVIESWRAGVPFEYALPVVQGGDKNVE